MTVFEDLSRKFAESWNKHDSAAASSLYTQSAVVHDPFYPEPIAGRAAIKTDAENFIRAFPDLRVEFLQTLEKGDTGAAEVRFSGTNRGPLATPTGDIPPTNKRVDLRGVAIVRFNPQGQITEERRYYDTGTMMQQLGLTPEVARAGTR